MLVSPARVRLPICVVAAVIVPLLDVAESSTLAAFIVPVKLVFDKVTSAALRVPFIVVLPLEWVRFLREVSAPMFIVPVNETVLFVLKVTSV